MKEDFSYTCIQVNINYLFGDAFNTHLFNFQVIYLDLGQFHTPNVESPGKTSTQTETIAVCVRFFSYFNKHSLNGIKQFNLKHSKHDLLLKIYSKN